MPAPRLRRAGRRLREAAAEQGRLAALPTLRVVHELGTLRALRAANMSGQTQVLVIDAPAGAARALGAFRPHLDRTHLICRWPGELAAAFSRRVARFLQKVRASAEVVALTLVLGGGDTPWASTLPALGADLAAALAPSGSLTLVGAGASQHELIASFEVLRQLFPPSVTVDAWFGSP